MRKFRTTLQWLWPIILTIFIVIVVIFIPPINLYVITALILLISLLFYFLLRFFFPKKVSLVTSVFIFLALMLLALNLLDLMNFILLLSLFVGVFTLLK